MLLDAFRPASWQRGLFWTTRPARAAFAAQLEFWKGLVSASGKQPAQLLQVMSLSAWFQQPLGDFIFGLQIRNSL